MSIRMDVGALGVGAFLSLAACLGGADGTNDSSGPGIAISVAPLSLVGITNVSYELVVRNGDSDIVFQKTLDSRQYGPGDGALTYVGPCDASVNDNTVSLTLLAMYSGTNGDALVAADAYENPGTLTQSVACAENMDVPIVFNLTIARDAQQGFFDVAINFSDVYCSAKLDCVGADDGPLELLFDAGERARTVVMGLACTGDTASGGQTHLYRNNIVITCDDGSATVDPSRGPGLLAEGSGIVSTGTSPLFGAAVYRGAESLGFNKRYWNVALGLAADAAGCVVTSDATASPSAFFAGRTPDATSYPFIDWSVTITQPTTAALACTRHPIGGASPNDGVSVVYTGLDATASFSHSFGPPAADLSPVEFRYVVAETCPVGQEGFCPELYTWNIPAGVTQVAAYAWGAGGNGYKYSSNPGAGGGSGAFAAGVIDVTGISQLVIAVGPGAEVWKNTIGDASLVGVFAESKSHANALLIAGSGGASTNFGANGGGGGVELGANGTSYSSDGACYGRGGSQSAGGATGAGRVGAGTPGAALEGGHGHPTWGGAGGAGYFGGGGGGGYYCGGGGGSSYFDPARVSAVTMEPGLNGNVSVDSLPGGATHPLYQAGVGVGPNGDVAERGGPGLVIIVPVVP